MASLMWVKDVYHVLASKESSQLPADPELVDCLNDS